MAQEILIIGATGGIGSEVARAFAGRGWQVKALARKPRQARKAFAHLGVLDWVKGDAMSERDVVRAAKSADVIFHGANPPNYVKWREKAIPMLANSIAAAETAGARLLFPGNIYNFGPDAWPTLSEDAPQNPNTVKGAIRVEMEQMIRSAPIRSLIVRAGDFFGPHAPGSWLSNAMVKPGRPVRKVTYPGLHDKGHAWAYLPDLAETFVRLVEVEANLASHERVHFKGHHFDRGVDMAHAIGQAAGLDEVKIANLPWAMIRLAAPFNGTFRSLLEMRYLWQQSIGLDNARLVSLIGEEPHTPLATALHETLTGLKCTRQESQLSAQAITA